MYRYMNAIEAPINRIYKKVLVIGSRGIRVAADALPGKIPTPKVGETVLVHQVASSPVDEETLLENIKKLTGSRPIFTTIDYAEFENVYFLGRTILRTKDSKSVSLAFQVNDQHIFIYDFPVREKCCLDHVYGVVVEGITKKLRKTNGILDLDEVAEEIFSKIEETRKRWGLDR